MKALQLFRPAIVRVALLLLVSTGAASAQTYSLVQGLEKFDGSVAAWHLLEKNGFVVADPSYKDMFAPYVDDSLPYFITTDSAWHGYHVLLAAGMRQLESSQTSRLQEFSRQLWTAAGEQAKAQPAEFSDLARFAAVGLALQDKSFRVSLPQDQQKLIDTLLASNTEAGVAIGPPLHAAEFHQHGGETNADWIGYRAAWQWYAAVEFRLSDTRETKLALSLTWLLNKQPELFAAWQKLEEPWAALLAPMSRGSITGYLDAEKASAGADASLSAMLKNVSAIQSHLAKATPAITGFRLLPPQQRQSALSAAISPGAKVPAGANPSGLDFLVASPSLRTAAAEQALRDQDGNALVDSIKQAGLPAPADSLRARALDLLKALQAPLPVRVGPALRSQAWADKQVWTQLGAWAELEHETTGHTMMRGGDNEADRPRSGQVEPYPDFFSGLGKLAGEAAEVFKKAGIEEAFDAKTTAQKLLDCVQMEQAGAPRSPEEQERMAGPLAQFNEFVVAYAKGPDYEENPNLLPKMMNDLEALARRCASQTSPSEADRKVLLHFFNSRKSVTKLMEDFGPFCERLAELARKHLEGAELSREDEKWIGGYGMKLASFQFFPDAQPEANSDSAALVNRIQFPGEGGVSYYAGVGRPETLYIILPAGGKLALYRGAVLSYREFSRTNEPPLEDAAWRDIAATGNVPPPPAFTASFFAERSMAELLKSFTSFNADAEGYKEVGEAMEEIQTRAVDRDVPALIAALGRVGEEQWQPVSDGLCQAIAKLRWQPYQRDLMALLETNGAGHAIVIAPILLEHPEGLDAGLICSAFDAAPPRARRIYCELLSRLPATDQTRATELRALSDSAPAVRWEAATVIETNAPNAGFVEPLLHGLSDTNQYVVNAMAKALARIKASNAAPAMVTNLDAWLKMPALKPQELRQQNEVVRDFPLNFARGVARMGGGGGGGDARFNFQRMGRMQNPLAFRAEEPPAAAGIIEALGDLGYHPAEERLFGFLAGADYPISAGAALKKLAPERLVQNLTQQACDKKLDPALREQALLILETPPAAGAATTLAPLLDDRTVIPGRRPLPGREWRICDRAADAIATLLGRPTRIQPMQTTELRDQQIEQVRQALGAGF